VKINWNINFEWIVTGAAVIGVIVLLVSGGQDPASSSTSGLVTPSVSTR
jgi:hypothetical protein